MQALERYLHSDISRPRKKKRYLHTYTHSSEKIPETVNLSLVLPDSYLNMKVNKQVFKYDTTNTKN